LLSTGFNHLAYGSVQVEKPRLTLTAPVNWQRAEAHPALMKFPGSRPVASKSSVASASLPP
jgi:hypothetical protein